MRRWTNWAGTVRSKPQAWHAPRSEAEVVDLLRGASGRTIRVVGGGHSWSAIAAPEQIGVTLDKLEGIVRFDVSAGRPMGAAGRGADGKPVPATVTWHEVTVRAGTRLRALNAALAANGAALPILGSIAEQSIAGAIATGTHGSSLVHGNLASLLSRMRLVDGRGNVHELTGDRLDAARVHLGALGIITEVTLNVVPAFRLAETIETMPIGDVPAALPAIAASAEYVKVWWMPHTPDALIIRYERTEDRATRGTRRQRWVDEKLMHAWLFPAILRMGRVPGLTRWISPRIAKGLVKPRRVGASTLMFATPMPARHREAEAAMPMAAAGDALARLVRTIDDNKLTVNFIVEARFVRGDNAWMSPAYGADTCQLGAYCYGPQTDAYFAAFWREMRAINARPHWGKEMDHTVDEIRALWPRADEFRALRDELDPDRVFASAFHTRILGR